MSKGETELGRSVSTLLVRSSKCLNNFVQKNLEKWIDLRCTAVIDPGEFVNQFYFRWEKEKNEKIVSLSNVQFAKRKFKAGGCLE